MNGRIIKDWTEFDYNNPKHRKHLATALQFFIALPGKHVPKQFAGTDAVSKRFAEKRSEHEKARLQFYTTLNDFPATAKEVIDSFHELAVYDNGYESVFDMRDYSTSRRDGFSMVTTQSGLTFKKMLTGEKLEVFQMSGDKEYVFFDYYGGALNWDKKLFDNQDYWTLEDNAIEFRNEAFRIKAATFYALIEAVAGTKADIAWAAPTPAALANTDPLYTAIRDANTMNMAAQTILLACQAKGYGVSPQNVNFVLLAPLQLRGRVKRALAVAPVVVGGTPQIDYNFQTVITTMLTATDHYWVVLPGRKNKGGTRLDLEILSDFDILTRAETTAGWMAFAGAIGDTDQFERCDTI
jgi:hypothetical protein